MKKLIIILILPLFLFCGLYLPVYSEISPAKAAVSLDEKLRPSSAPAIGEFGKITENRPAVKSVQDILTKVVNAIFYLIGGIAIYFIVYAGFMYVTARGNEEELNKARGVLLWTVLGLLLTIFSYTIVANIIQLLQKFS